MLASHVDPLRRLEAAELCAAARRLAFYASEAVKQAGSVEDQAVYSLFLEGLSWSEIAERLDLGQHDAKSRYYRLLDKVEWRVLERAKDDEGIRVYLPAVFESGKLFHKSLLRLLSLASSGELEELLREIAAA